MEALFFLTIVILNLVLLVIAKEGVLLNTFALAFNLIATFECVTWLDYLFITLFAILQAIVILDKVLA
jgi:hypothetical protein